MRKMKKIICAAAVMAVLCLASCGKKEEGSVYGPAIGSLGDEELFAIVEIGADAPVLLVTDRYYDDREANQVSIFCNVYYAADGEVRKLGTVESLGTAYPISYDDSGLYAGSGHGMQRFVIDDGTDSLVLAEELAETFDSGGNAAYMRTSGGQTEMITEEEFLTGMEQYKNAVAVHFAYGATGT